MIDMGKLKQYNLPTSYLQYMNENVNFDMYYDFNVNNIKKPESGEEYGIWSQRRLNSNVYSDKVKNFAYLSDDKLYYKELEFSNKIHNDDNLTVDIIKKSFSFGRVDGGIIFFSQKDNSIWAIFGDLFLQKIAPSFEYFLQHSKFSRKIDASKYI